MPEFLPLAGKSLGESNDNASLTVTQVGGKESASSSAGTIDEKAVSKSSRIALQASRRLLQDRRGVFSTTDSLAADTLNDVALSAMAERKRLQDDEEAPQADAASASSSSGSPGIVPPGDMTRQWYEENCENGHQDALKEPLCTLVKVGES